VNLRQRLSRQAAWAIVALVLGFGAVSWAVTAGHLYAVTRADALVAAQALAEPESDRASDALQMLQYRFAGDPAVWLTRAGHTVRSVNAPSRKPPPDGLQDLVGQRPALVVSASVDGRSAVVSWPLAPDLDVMRDLLIVLGLLGAVSGALGWWLGSWATARMLVPVERMTRAVEAMVAGGRVTPLPERVSEEAEAGPEDEFNHLSQVFNSLLRAMALQAEREREVLREVAHEIRTPLQVLRGNLDVMAASTSEDGGFAVIHQESLDQSRQVIDRLARVVGDVLTVERMRTGRAETAQPVNLTALVHQVGPDAVALASGLSVSWTAAGSAWVRATAWTVERALWSVLDNAIKYTPAGGVVTLALVRDAGRAGVSIADTGLGIPPDELPRVFDRFYRGRAARQQPGSGLGLAMAHALVEYDGGTVVLESVVGRGTTVTLWWPLWQGDDPAGSRGSR